MYILNLKIFISFNIIVYFWEYALTLEKNILLLFSSINIVSNCTLNTSLYPQICVALTPHENSFILQQMEAMKEIHNWSNAENSDCGP